MNRSISKYLKDVCCKISSRRLRHSTYKELRFHLYSAVDAEVIKGKPWDDAVSAVLSEATPAKALGKKLDLASRPWYWRHRILTSSFALSTCSLLVLVFLSHYLVDQVFLPRLQHSMADEEKLLDRFEKDLLWIEQNPIFNDSKRNRNAAVYLQEKLYFDHSFSEELNSAKQIENKLLAEDLEQYFSTFREWRKKQSEFDELIRAEIINKLDTSWLSELDDFDHFDQNELPKVKKMIESAKFSNGVQRARIWSTLPILSLVELRYLAAIHVIQESRKGNAVRSMKRYRHITELIHSSGYLIGQMVAVQMMTWESDLVRLLKIENWKPISEHSIAAYRRISWGWASVIHKSLYLGKISDRWKPFLNRRFGICAGVTENQLGLGWMNDFLRPNIPFEGDYSVLLENAESVSMKLNEVCNTNYYQNYLHYDSQVENSFWNHNMRKVWVVEGGGFFDFLPNPSRLPFVRRIIAFYLGAVGVPNYLGVYRQLLREEETTEKKSDKSA